MNSLDIFKLDWFEKLPSETAIDRLRARVRKNSNKNKDKKGK